MTQPTCQVCARRSTLFICSGCTTDLREMLQGLAARWLQFLQDAALGHTRLGDAVRHRRGDEQPMRLNLKAADLLAYVRSVLVEWIRDLCETRGVQVPALSATVDMALWLARNVSAIAADEGAGVCYREIKQIVEDIERVINRPVPPRICGPCPVLLADESVCGTALTAKRDQKEIQCPSCRTAHNVEELIQAALGNVDGWLFTAREVLDLMAQLGEPISDRTWRHWRKTGKIQSRNELGAEPKYFIEEVRHLRSTQAKLRAS